MPGDCRQRAMISGNGASIHRSWRERSRCWPLGVTYPQRVRRNPLPNTTQWRMRWWRNCAPCSPMSGVTGMSGVRRPSAPAPRWQRWRSGNYQPLTQPPLNSPHPLDGGGDGLSAADRTHLGAHAPPSHTQQRLAVGKGSCRTNGEFRRCIFARATANRGDRCP